MALAAGTRMPAAAGQVKDVVWLERRTPEIPAIDAAAGLTQVTVSQMAAKQSVALLDLL